MTHTRPEGVLLLESVRVLERIVFRNHVDVQIVEASPSQTIVGSSNFPAVLFTRPKKMAVKAAFPVRSQISAAAWKVMQCSIYHSFVIVTDLQ